MKKFSFLLAFLFFSVAVMANEGEKATKEGEKTSKEEVSVSKNDASNQNVVVGDCAYITGTITCCGGGGSTFSTQGNGCESAEQAVQSMNEMAEIICPGGYTHNGRLRYFQI